MSRKEYVLVNKFLNWWKIVLLPNNFALAGKYITQVKKQTKITNDFLRVKDLKHGEEDPAIPDPLSDVFDIRKWNLSSFDPLSLSNTHNISFENERENDKKY